MKLEIKRIFLQNVNEKNDYVNYRNQLQPRRDFDDSELEALFDAHETEIMKIVEQGISDYVNDDDLCADEGENFFPRRQELTGEWYVERISFSEDILIVGTAFLTLYKGEKHDYLGLDVFLRYDENLKQFVFEGDINQSVK